MSAIVSTIAVKQYAAALGFNLVGIVQAQPSPQLHAFLQWIATGMQGSMGYLARPDRTARRRDLNVILPHVQSMIIVGVDYHTTHVPAHLAADPSRGRIAAYAWGQDYHTVLLPKLESLATWLTTQTSHPIQHRSYVDTGAILERSHAQQSGLGFVGKNTMVIHPRRGSYFFLGEILTTAVFDSYDDPAPDTMCGSCTRCQTACPTSAFPQPYILDARRCISYLTIEHKGWIDAELRPLMGNWVMGCDVCQDVCPFNRFAVPTAEPTFYTADEHRYAPLLLDLLALDETTFKQWYKDTPVERLTRTRLVRNACIAAGNWGHVATLPSLLNLLHDPQPLLRGHAAWALQQLRVEASDGHTVIRRALDDQLQQETDLQVADALRRE